MPESDNQLVRGLTHTYSTSIIFIIVSSSLVINTLLMNTFESFMGGCLILSGLPLYFYFRQKKGRVRTVIMKIFLNHGIKK